MSRTVPLKNLTYAHQCTHLILSPFDKVHTQLYAQWMQDQELRILTCTPDEAMRSLEQVIEAQERFASDLQCYVWIIGVKDEYGALQWIGDVSMFLHGWLEGEDSKVQVEVDVMIAEKKFRGCKFGGNAVRCAMRYLSSSNQSVEFVAKIHDGNHASRALFGQKLHFQYISFDPTFKQHEYRWEGAMAHHDAEYSESDSLEDAQEWLLQ